MRSHIPVLLAAVFLSGCALPPVITVASLALNGVSYATTGKSTSDHAISAYVGEDCALLRAAGDKEICDPNGEVLFKKDTSQSANANLYLDPEIGVTSAASQNYQGPATTLYAASTQGATDNAPAALSRSSALEGSDQQPLANLLALATEPTSHGRFANARPAPKPASPTAP